MKISGNSIALSGDEEILSQLSNKKMKTPLSRKIFIVCMLLWQVLHFLLFWVYVNVDSFIMAFQTLSMKLDETYGKVIWVGWQNFKDVFRTFETGDLWNCIKNSFILFAVNNFVIVPIATFCAYIFFKKIPLGKIFRVIFFLPNIISIVILTMVYTFMFELEWGPFNILLETIGLADKIPPLGWLGDPTKIMTMVVIYCIWAGIGYNVVFLNGAICRIPTEIIESGQIDGAGMWTELFTIIFPLVMPTLSTLFINGVTVIFTIFLQPRLLSCVPAGYNHVDGTIAGFIIELVENGKSYQAAATGLFFSAIGIPLVLGVKKLIEAITPDITW